MAWNILAAFSAYQRATSAVMEQIRENLNILKSPQIAISTVTLATDITTTSTTFVDVNTTWYQVTITPSIASGTCSLRVWTTLSVQCSTTTTTHVVKFDLMIDGVSVSAGAGIAMIQGNQNQYFPVTIDYLITGVAPGAHTIKLRWRNLGGGNTTLFANNGSTIQVRTQFGAMEI